MFGLGKSDEEERRERLSGNLEAGRQGIKKFGPNRSAYQVQGIGAYRDAAQAGVGAEQQLMGEMAQRSRTGYGAGEAMIRDAARQQAGTIMSSMAGQGINPALAGYMGQQASSRAFQDAANQASIMRAREQQFADQARIGLAGGMAQRGLGAEQMQLGANQAFDANRLQAAQMLINPEAQAQMAEEQRKADRNQAIIGGLFNAGGAALGGWLGGG